MHVTLKAALLVSSALIATPALSQIAEPPPPSRYSLDARGIDLATGRPVVWSTDVAIGPAGTAGLTYQTNWVPLSGWEDNARATITEYGTAVAVNIGGASVRFNRSGLTYSPVEANGQTLARANGGIYLDYTDRAGTVYRFTAPPAYTFGPEWNVVGVLRSVTQPSGQSTQYHYNFIQVQDPPLEDPEGPWTVTNQQRLQGVTNNHGYALKFEYAADEAEDSSGLDAWLKITKATGFNMAVDACDALAFHCNFTQAWPSATYAETLSQAGYLSTRTVTDSLGRTTTYRYDANAPSILIGVRLPGSAADNVAFAGGYRVQSVTMAGSTWTYGYTDMGGERVTQVTDPLNQSSYARTTIANGRLLIAQNALNQRTEFTYDAQGRLKRSTAPEGNFVEYAYDGRGNVLQTKAVAKDGSNQPDLTISATYDATCANVRTCNQPLTTTDALGSVTDYTYDPAHGGVLSVTPPAPTTGAARPQTRIAYAAQTAWYKNGAGNVVAAPSPIVLPVSISACATGTAAACVDTADEVRTTLSYGVGGVANNLLPMSVAEGSGADPSMTVTTLTYAASGDTRSVDGPLTGAEDTTTYRYDVQRQPVGVIGPDPDGGGPLLRRAVRYSYDAAGRASLIEQGTVNGLTDPDWTAFSSLQQVSVTRDAYGRPTHERFEAGGTTFSLVQTSYDAASRSDCVATRMNPAAFSSLPGSACELGAQGAYGPDRTIRYGYDVADQLISTTSGFGAGSAITESATYTANGLPQTLTDGAGNVSTMVYDGFDRLLQMRYPNASGGGSSTTDYEEYGYDANSNATSFRNRAGEVVNTQFDALGRPTAVTGAVASIGGLYNYDNLSRMVSASAHGGGTWTTGYDALSRVVSQGSVLGTANYGYDLASRRTSIQWPDGFWVAYDYNLANDLTSIRENGATNWQLANWSYDNLGRKIWQGSANGAVTTWGYDGASRLTSLSHNLAGTSNDLTLGFTYNPAGQILTRTMSNPAYTYTPGTGNTAYANNGKNHVTSVNGAGVSYDGRQNITSVPGVGSYGYNQVSQLTSANGAALFYDPLDRMSRSIGSAEDVMFFYDGQQAIAEYNGSGSLMRRYVPGLGLDDVVTAYEGAGYDRRWLIQDERRSVVSITDGAANALTTNTYDEYGQPGSGNGGRFQYTGQMWMPQAQLYHYRTRAYAPTLGRFMQTDPIGYQAGANLYGYVGGDPVNFTDPMGLASFSIICVSNPEYNDGSTGGWTSVPAEVCERSPLRDRLTAGDVSSWGLGGPSAFGRGGLYSGLPGGGEEFDRGPVFNDPQFQPYQERRLAALEANQAPVWIIMAVFAAPAAIEAGAFASGSGLWDAAVAARQGIVAFEGPAAGYTRYGVGRMGQMRFGTNRLIFRIDAKKPITHLNVQGRLGGKDFNFHFPGW
ncbi:RHS repeat domain-containing protein [Brevundimonas sp.]|uniref:RHS repeat domain-containing protein n=1 Tax=Brevundimonas sp. TaxID=1871086 RepID=UPI003D108087